MTAPSSSSVHAEPRFLSAPEVHLVEHHGTDAGIVHAARVSTTGTFLADAVDTLEAAGLIAYLMEHRHGTPFEHNSVTLRVHAPIFVFREWHRHRIGWSYNEESGRYRQLEPVFHVPDRDRPLVNAGTSARPQMVAGAPEQNEGQVARMKRSYALAYAAYEDALAAGVAKEVAREVLPVGTYSSMYATANLRSLLAFLSLRIHEPDATFVSHPQYEIEQAARQVEAIVQQLFPLSHAAFVAAGRVAP